MAVQLPLFVLMDFQRLKVQNDVDPEDCFFSSPEPKAQGELIVWDSSRRASIRPCDNTFKHEYL